jgi:hypothetical protein
MTDSCPTCGAEFVVPGAAERGRLRNEKVEADDQALRLSNFLRSLQRDTAADSGFVEANQVEAIAGDNAISESPASEVLQSNLYGPSTPSPDSAVAKRAAKDAKLQSKEVRRQNLRAFFARRPWKKTGPNEAKRNMTMPVFEQASGASSRIEKLNIGLDPNVWDEDTIKILNRMNDHYDAVMRQQDAELREFARSMEETRLIAESKTRRRRVTIWLVCVTALIGWMMFNSTNYRAARYEVRQEPATELYPKMKFYRFDRQTGKLTHLDPEY